MFVTFDSRSRTAVRITAPRIVDPFTAFLRDQFFRPKDDVATAAITVAPISISRM